MASNVIPCSESFWLRDAILDHIRKSESHVSRDDLCKEFSRVDESLIINELRCLDACGSIRMLYDDMTCFFVLT